jgi:hypothetical protein
MSKKAKLLKLAVRKTENVFIPELDEELTVRSLNAKELNEYIDFVQSGTNNVESIIRLLMVCVVDEDDNPMFDDSDYDAITNLPVSVLLLLADACQRVSGLDKDIKRDVQKN